MKMIEIPELDQKHALATNSCSRLVSIRKPAAIPAWQLSFKDYITITKEDFTEFFLSNIDRYVNRGSADEGYSIVKKENTYQVIISERARVCESQSFRTEHEAILWITDRLWNFAVNQLDQPSRLRDKTR